MCKYRSADISMSDLTCRREMCSKFGGITACDCSMFQCSSDRLYRLAHGRWGQKTQMTAAGIHPLLAMLLDSQSKPSYRPSPDVAQVLWMYLQQDTGALRQHCVHKVAIQSVHIAWQGQAFTKQLAVMHAYEVVCTSFRLFSNNSPGYTAQLKVQDTLYQ